MLALLAQEAQYTKVLQSSRRARLVEAAVLIAAATFIYARALPGPFVFDDLTAIVDNESVHGLWPLGPVLAQPPDLTTSGRPIAALSMAVDYALVGPDARLFRATNIALHLACALLFAAVVRRTLRGPRLAERFAASADRIAFGSALLFLVHPLASEVASYVSARTESLVALFYLATLYLAICARTSPRPWGFVAGAIACSALGMATKEVMVTAPLVVALHDLVFLDREAPSAPRVRSVLWTGLAATWGVLGSVVLTEPRSESAGFALWVTPAMYLANQCRILVTYLSLVVWPSALRLDYGLPEPLGLGDVWPAAALLVALLALSLYALWRWPAAGFVGVACFVLLAPSSSVVPIASEVGAERRMYLPLATLTAGLVCTAWLALVRGGRVRLAPWLLGFAALTLGALSAQRAGAHADEIALWRADVVAAPMNARARFNLAGALKRAGRAKEARDERAAAVQGEISFYQRILPFQPDRVQALGDLATLYLVAGDLPRADELYGELLELAPGDPLALERRALVRERLAAPREGATPPP
jgi:hypothetical protein